MKSLSNRLFWAAVPGVLALQLASAECIQAQEHTAYSFCKVAHCYDGKNPTATLIDGNGTLYGTTRNGGITTYYNSGYGAVFSFDPDTGAEKTLYRFCIANNCADGSHPYGSLIDVGGMLYGTTAEGGHAGCGSYGCGTVFSLNPNNGKETVPYSFCSQQNCDDGASPRAGLIDVNGVLVGTTYEGGTGCGGSGCGTLFSLDPATGVETVRYSFCRRPNCADGSSPAASLIEAHGKLYGTTYGGGKRFGGTVFSFDPDTGREEVIYSFCSLRDCMDGEHPQAGVIDVHGTLYGTTELGGSSSAGTVFSLDPSTGTERTLYSFCSQVNCADGNQPEASLIDVRGVLYGTTELGGSGGHRQGTVFSLDPAAGTETVLYSFCQTRRCWDGDSPEAGLLEWRGTMYGTTSSGGRHGGGEIFSVKNP